jgi:hypothetical protein
MTSHSHLIKCLHHSLAASQVGNTGNLPLVLVSSLGSNPALPFLLGSGELGLQYVSGSNVPQGGGWEDCRFSRQHAVWVL